MRLLLIEDDDILGEALRDFLRAEGHGVDWCRRLADALALRGESYDALLVDWQLPDGSGLDWLQQRRLRGDLTPALMLTARDLLGDRIQGLDQGADDYLVKPFAPEELVARLRAVARRSAGNAASRAALVRRWRRCTHAPCWLSRKARARDRPPKLHRQSLPAHAVLAQSHRPLPLLPRPHFQPGAFHVCESPRHQLVRDPGDRLRPRQGLL